MYIFPKVANTQGSKFRVNLKQGVFCYDSLFCHKVLTYPLNSAYTISKLCRKENIK